MFSASGRHRPSIAAAAVILLAALTAGAAAPVAAATRQSGLVPVRAQLAGSSYPEWAAAWWQWALSIPRPHNPLIDSTGADCAVAQTEKVWFLAGTLGGRASRTCWIPAGTPVFFPIISYLCAADPGMVSTYAQQLACARSSNAGATGTLEIDGRTVQHLERHRIESTEFTLTLPSDNVIEGLPGTYTSAAAEGIFVLLVPLTPGGHTIRYIGSNNSGVSLDVTYHLIVGP